VTHRGRIAVSPRVRTAFPDGVPGSGTRTTEQRPDTDERDDPGGTPSAGPDNLTAKPVAPGTDEATRPTAVPGAYEADDEDQQRGRAVKPGN
jgi:hypothetical protein